MESSLYRILEDLVSACFVKPAAPAELLDARRYEHASRRCAELGAMVGGWRNATSRALR